MKKILLFLICLVGISPTPLFSGSWDILDKDMSSWNTDGGSVTNKAWIRSASGSGSIPASAIVQEVGYVNINKTFTFHNFNYLFLVSPALTLSGSTPYTIEIKARLNLIDKILYPDSNPPGSGEGGFESNQLSARLNNKGMAVHVKYGTEDGYISIGAGQAHDEEAKYVLNTAEWHIYRFVLHADNSKYDVYIDDNEEPIFENVSTFTSSGSNILKLGAESFHRCNMDIEYVKMGTGDFASKPKITSIDLSSDSHIETNERTINVIVNTALVEDGEKVNISMVTESDVEVVPSIEGTIQSHKANVDFTIPSTLPTGKYLIKAEGLVGQLGDVDAAPKYAQYVVVDGSPFENGLLPEVKPVGFIKEIDDYVYEAPSREFIFPSVIDTKPYTIDGKFLNGDDAFERYYCFYSPHENPGGMFLATAPSLDGPWTEHNTVVDLDWAKAVEGSNVNTADHISACQVIWNAYYNKYFMYFHGPNSTTHYATSDNLVDWTFGGSILNAQNFGTKGNEASYAKVFSYSVPGLSNQFILMLMIAESNMRKIYWAHSQDGIEWTGVKKPLISPDLSYKKIPGTDLKPNYHGAFGNNVSGPFFMAVNGRYFVFFHGSSGNICVAEVGEYLDMEVHWGEYMKSSDVIIDTDINGNDIAVSRVAAPQFISDESGTWYMFFEAGSRLGANIAYAKEELFPTLFKDPKKEKQIVRISSSFLGGGEETIISVVDDERKISMIQVYSIDGTKVFSETLEGDSSIKVVMPTNTGVYVVLVSLDNGMSQQIKAIVR